MTKTKWGWAGTRTWGAAARTMRTTRRKAPGTKREAMRSELEGFSSSTVILFCNLHGYPCCSLPPLFAVLLAQSWCGQKKPSSDELSYLYMPYSPIIKQFSGFASSIYMQWWCGFAAGILCCSIFKYCSAAVFPNNAGMQYFRVLPWNVFMANLVPEWTLWSQAGNYTFFLCRYLNCGNRTCFGCVSSYCGGNESGRKIT